MSTVGAVKDDSKTLRDIRVMNGAKMMIVGSTVTDVMTLAAPLPASDKQKEEESGVFLYLVGNTHSLICHVSVQVQQKNLSLNRG